MHCGCSSTPTLNQTGELKAHLLVDQQVRQLGLEGREVVVRREVVLRRGPGGDGVDHAVDELLDAALASGRADVAAEVLADHDVGGELAPEGRHLDVRPADEDGLARLVLDLCGAQLPGDLVVGVHARRRPAPLPGQAVDVVAGEATLLVDGRAVWLVLARAPAELPGWQRSPRFHRQFVVVASVLSEPGRLQHVSPLPLYLFAAADSGASGRPPASPNARYGPGQCQD